MTEVFETNIDDLAAQHSYWWLTDDDSPRPLEDYTDRYEFDLVGNRVRKTIDLDASTSEVYALRQKYAFTRQ